MMVLFPVWMRWNANDADEDEDEDDLLKLSDGARSALTTGPSRAAFSLSQCFTRLCLFCISAVLVISSAGTE